MLVVVRSPVAGRTLVDGRMPVAGRMPGMVGRPFVDKVVAVL